ncbi:MAG: polyprenyl synthetase family protein [Rikenellaceae bacterium]
MNCNDQLLERFESYLGGINLPTEPERLYAPITYSLDGGGKRIRPMLVMLSYLLYAERLEAILPAAAAVEIFHNFTLLHDDIMDNADIRRGKPSVHAAWGENVAILSGDVMVILAYRQLAMLKTNILPELLETFNTMAIEVCEGQQYDMDFEQRESVSVEEYMHMIRLKTSVLLGGAAKIGARAGGATPEQAAKITELATELGLAFQLQDDLLDSYGDEALGKKIGGDILEGKQTYLMIEAKSLARDKDRALLCTTHKNSTMSDEQKIATIKGIYNALDIPHLTELQIALHFERALSLLSSLELEESKTYPLRQFAEGLMNRNK